MDSKRYREIINEADNRRRGIVQAKGPEYTGGHADVLRNFKVVGKRLGIPPLVVLGVYMNKHLDSINTFLKEETYTWFNGGPDLSERMEQGEGIISRLDDARNYMDLCEALLEDELDG